MFAVLYFTVEVKNIDMSVEINIKGVLKHLQYKPCVVYSNVALDVVKY